MITLKGYKFQIIKSIKRTNAHGRTLLAMDLKKPKGKVIWACLLDTKDGSFVALSRGQVLRGFWHGE